MFFTVSTQISFSQVAGSACFTILSNCSSNGPGSGYFNPGPITFNCSITYTEGRLKQRTTTVSAVSSQTEYGWEVCFNPGIPFGLIVGWDVCTDASTTGYVVSEIEGGSLYVGGNIYLDKKMPKEATIGGHFYKAWHTPVGYTACEEVWPYRYNDEHNYNGHPIPTWVTCQDEINVKFEDGLELDSDENSGICLQIAIHEYPIGANRNTPISYRQYSDYTPGANLNIANLLTNLEPGNRYEMSLATVCCNSSYVPYSNKINNHRILTFDYEADITWDGWLGLGQGLTEEWDNTFPGSVAKSNTYISSTIAPFYNRNTEAYYKYEIIRLDNQGNDEAVLFSSGILYVDDFFDYTTGYISRALNELTDNYFLTSTNEFFAVRVSTDDVCDYYIRNVYFQTDNTVHDPPVNFPDSEIRSSTPSEISINFIGNPSNTLKVVLDSECESHRTQMYVSNSSGKQMLITFVNEGMNNILESANWPPGIYYLAFYSSNKIISKKWIKQ